MINSTVIFKPVVGYEDIYEVSNTGIVRSINRMLPNKQHRKGKVLYTHLINGYVVVSLCKNGKQINKKVHRLVAQAFIANPENKPCVDHINTDRENNHVSNLRWCTYQENSDNIISSKAQKRAASNSGCRPVLQLNKNQEIIGSYKSIYDAARITNTNPTAICNCCRGRIHTANGHYWKYKNEE